MTKVERLKQMAKDKKRVAFLVKTPTSERGIPVQAVMLKDFDVRKASPRNGGHYYVIGRDLQMELIADHEQDRTIAPGAHRRRAETMIRNFRVSRIVDRTIISA